MLGKRRDFAKFYLIADRRLTNRSLDSGFGIGSDVTSGRMTEDSHNFSKEEMIRPVSVCPPDDAFSNFRTLSCARSLRTHYKKHRSASYQSSSARTHAHQ
jgi:hypothetical protein